MDKMLISKFLTFLSEKSPDVFWIRNADYSQQIYISPAYETIWQRDIKELYQYPEKWSDYLHADDLESMNENTLERGDSVSSDTEFYAEYRIVRPSGEVRFIKDHSFTIFDELGAHIGFAGIARDVTEEIKLKQSLVTSKEQSEAANRAKTEFLANMSHDVKTPMTGVVSVADLMAHNPNWCTPEKAVIIHSCGLQVLNFFNSCLELSKLEMTEWSSAEEAFSLKTLLEEIYALFLPRAQSKNLEFEIDYDAHLPQALHGHRGSLYRVILNLVGNALKFTENGSVSVSAFLVKTVNENTIQVGIEVKDTGVGIPEDKQEIIFEKLRRLTPSYEGKIEGSGIGLYIVDQYVKRMNGAITVESKVGQGSTFIVTLPINIANDVALLEENEKKSTSCANEIATATLASANLNESSTHPQARAQSAPHILLVEDSEIIQMVTKTLLNDAGFHVDIAGTGTEAIAAFSPGKYGLIYMDIGLPDMDGYAVTRAIREKETLSQVIMTPIVALTGHGAIDVQAFCGKAGMQGVLSKPIKREQIEGVWKRYGKNEAIHVEGLTILENSSTNTDNIQVIDKAATVALLGSEEKAKSMLTFLAEELTSSFLPTLETSIQQKNYDEICRLLHAMLGNLCYVKAPLLHQAILKFQAAAQAHSQTIENSYQEIKEQAQHFLSAWRH